MTMDSPRQGGESSGKCVSFSVSRLVDDDDVRQRAHRDGNRVVDRMTVDEDVLRTLAGMRSRT
jgi:hypothetical protein